MQPKIFGHPLYYDVARLFENEVFVPIPGLASGYFISNYGRVKSEGLLAQNGKGVKRCRARILRPAKTKANYHTVAPSCQSHTIHSLMRRAFMPEGAHLREVDHIDGDKINNVLSNLECVSSAVNKARAFATGLNHNVGETHGMAKLTEQQVWAVLSAYYLENLSRKKVGKKLGLSEFTCRSIIIGENWAAQYAKFAALHPVETAANRAQIKLSPAIAAEIRRKGLVEKQRGTVLAREYGVNPNTIYKILSGASWA